MRSALIFAMALCACTTESEPARPAAGESSASPAESPSLEGPSLRPDEPGAGPAAPEIQRSTRSSLQWKRYATFENDLSAALELAPDALCNELGGEPCIRGVHLGPLGGHDIRTGLLESPAEPLVTTPSVVERVLLSACLARVAKEQKEGVKLLAGLDLTGAAPVPGSPSANALVTSLVRRFFARDPSEEELAVLGGLARDERGAASDAATFAVAVCLALGSSSEFLFF